MNLLREAIEQAQRATESLPRRPEQTEAQHARIDRAERLRRSGAWGSLDPTSRACVLAGRGKRTPFLTAHQRWADTTMPIHVLCGPVGTGKSTAAAWWIATTDRAALWLTANVLVRVFGRSWDTPEQSAALAVPLLVIDDLGRENDSLVDATSAALLEVIDSRRGRRTTITTNLTRAQMLERYDCGRLGSRLMQDTLWTEQTGADMRKEG